MCEPGVIPPSRSSGETPDSVCPASLQPVPSGAFAPREPLLLPLLALAAGILVAHFVFFQLSDLGIAAILTVAISLVCLLFRVRRAVSWTAALLVFSLTGVASQVIHRQVHTPKLNVDYGETVLLDGCVVNPPVFSPGREQFTLDLGRQATIRVSVNLKNEATVPLDYGQKVEIAAKVRSPHNFQNPDAFDYAAYLAAQHIFWTGSVSNVDDIRIQPGQCGSRAIALLFRVRTWALGRIRTLYPDDPHTVGLLQATLLGETGGVDRRWTSDFRVTGTYHALVISGQHVSVLAFTILLILRLLRVRRLPALFVATTASWLYAFISGFSSPVVRAAGGFTLFLAASFFFRRTRILNILAVVGLVYLTCAPDELFDPSFQLSFLSAAAIAAFAIPVTERMTEPLRAAVKHFDQRRYDPQVEARAAQWRVELRLLSRTLQRSIGLSASLADSTVARGTLLTAFVADTVLISACVQFGLALPMVTYFHRLSVTGLSANIIIIPLLSLVVPLGFASFVTGWHPVAWITKQLLWLAEAVAAWHAHLEPSWRVAALPLWLSVGFSASLLLLAFCVRHRQRAAILPALATSLGLFGVLCWQPWKPDFKAGFLELSAIDVSQGDSLLVVFPDGETMLVDAGGFPGAERMKRKPQLDMGEDVVAPYLWSRRIRHIDYAVLTHGHSDHMGGLASILDDFRPKQLWIGAEPETPEWLQVKAAAARDSVQIRPLHRDCPDLAIGGAKIRVLSPSPGYLPGEKAANDDSLVLEIAYKQRSILLTGDAEKASEVDMEQSGVLHPVTLLKVGHHGSKTSTSEEFLADVRPQFAIISDGYKNQFHHPHPTVLERLNDHHVAVFRTDQRGLITFRTDGTHVELLPFH